MNLLIHIDGGSRGNPGPAAAGVVIQNADTGATVHEAGYFLGQTTNNYAEYMGLVHALKTAAKLGAKQVRIISDSQLMVRQINGEYRVKSPDLKPLHDQAHNLLAKFTGWRMEHVLRAHNARADELANKAMDAGRDVSEHSPKKPTLPVTAAHPDQPPRFTVQVYDAAANACPHPCGKDQKFYFGLTTPADLCVYAAQTVLSRLPLATHPSEPLPPNLICPRCGSHIQIDLLD